LRKLKNNLCKRKSPTKPKRNLTTNALIAEMRFFGIPIKSLPTANARRCGLMVARIMYGSVARRKTVK